MSEPYFGMQFRKTRVYCSQRRLNWTVTEGLLERSFFPVGEDPSIPVRSYRDRTARAPSAKLLVNFEIIDPLGAKIGRKHRFAFCLRRRTRIFYRLNKC